MKLEDIEKLKWGDILEPIREEFLSAPRPRKYIPLRAIFICMDKVSPEHISIIPEGSIGIHLDHIRFWQRRENETTKK